MKIDLHNHSTWSRDGSDTLKQLAENAVRSGLDVLGITDHNYWVGRDRLEDYRQSVYALQKEYQGELRILCGLEVSMIRLEGIVPKDLDPFDYCLFEYYEHVISTEEMVAFRDKTVCPSGIAHMDLFAMSDKEGIDVAQVWAEHDMFWELNMNLDEIHGYMEHSYCTEFMNSREQQSHVKACGLELSVGFDTHMLKDYDISRIEKACRFIEDNGFPYTKII